MRSVWHNKLENIGQYTHTNWMYIQNRFQRVVSIFKQFPAVSNYKLDFERRYSYFNIYPVERAHMETYLYLYCVETWKRVPKCCVYFKVLFRRRTKRHRHTHTQIVQSFVRQYEFAFTYLYGSIRYKVLWRATVTCINKLFRLEIQEIGFSTTYRKSQTS